ncbi:hypothetical protein AURANDRAFT_69118 [Aureococcus anophagefferens]|uniref:S1 motif domain-containing protein n=1 Tax=Aureococcus anophagefferens TaxID=44056 RepID=F0YRS3_AURAN|nr:hypothetical protein AURANDRAFT_69118 [Aureococcus anophagefferens]EGB02186.1 hypothetical protein AURANDRAFT_69118 [Aureococcus anophagefferens]|eukprot:XP_009043115.1 hypothetical protein AURANDRAFT_69118 [Aureococcus anophagefferens]
MCAALLHIVSDLARSSTTFVEGIILLKVTSIPATRADGVSTLVVCSIIAVGASAAILAWLREVYHYVTAQKPEGALRPHTHAPPRRRAVALRAGEFVPVGAVRAGEVTRVESYGCFVKLDDGGASGLVHVSELSHERARPEDVVAVGQPVLVKVLAPREPGRTSFSLKAVDQRTGAASAPPKRARKPAATTKVSLDDCVVSYSRASGAGGQNVNKVSTKAELRFSVDDSKLPPAVRAQLRATHAARFPFPSLIHSNPVSSLIDSELKE